MLNLLRKFLRPTLREQLEDGVREALRKYADRHAAPSLRVFVSTDLVPEGIDAALWSRDEGEHLRRFALQGAEDNDVARAGLRTEVVLLDTKREFAFVKPLGVQQPEEARPKPEGPPRPPRPMVESAGRETAVFEVPSSPSLSGPVTVLGELVVGRKAEGDGVFGIGDRYMSARHARLHVTAGKAYVTDLDSKNRTFVNDRPIPPHEAVPLRVGDEVRLGMTTLRLASVG
ncbi:MAG TPA: FHA domain-containing protein [Longimicrobiaceae bacterium]|nr:FHA domain-containing protein [Longimicrobiaceae bacterium]